GCGGGGGDGCGGAAGGEAGWLVPRRVRVQLARHRSVLRDQRHQSRLPGVDGRNAALCRPGLGDEPAGRHRLRVPGSADPLPLAGEESVAQTTTTASGAVTRPLAAPEVSRPSASLWRDAWRRLRRNRAAL